VTRIERDKDILFDILAQCTGVGAGDNKIYFCREINCDDCAFQKVCNSGNNYDVTVPMVKWLNDNWDSQKEDIFDYLCDDIAVNTNWNNEYTRCNYIFCRECLFREERGCTLEKKKYFKEEV